MYEMGNGGVFRIVTPYLESGRMKYHNKGMAISKRTLALRQHSAHIWQK